MIDREISSKKHGGVRVWPSGVRIEIARVAFGTASTHDGPVNTSRFVKKCDMLNSL